MQLCATLLERWNVVMKCGHRSVRSCIRSPQKVTVKYWLDLEAPFWADLCMLTKVFA